MGRAEGREGGRKRGDDDDDEDDDLETIDRLIEEFSFYELTRQCLKNVLLDV